jgi:probable rRNA maturation factor
VLIVGDQKIKTLNRKFRHKDKVTDVLSFSQKEGQKIVLPSAYSQYLGDIMICLPQVKRQAEKFGHSLKWEFSLLLIHGLLHLLGYNDQTDAQYQKMKVIQDKILMQNYG